MSKTLYILGALLIAGFGVLGMLEMMKAQTPYFTSVADVKRAADRPVQFMGSIAPGGARYGEQTGELSFVLRDGKGETMPVRYTGVKPAGFDSADRAVVRGAWHGNKFVADQLLLKCPSKYKGKR